MPQIAFSIVLFVLVGSRKLVAALLVIVGAAWWFACDYFVSVSWWSPAWEHFGFLIFPAAWICGAVFFEWFRLRATWSRYGPPLALVDEQDCFGAKAWGRMIRKVAADPRCRSKAFLDWMAGTVETLSAGTHISGRRIWRLWWTKPRVALVAVGSLWLPASCVGLILVPLRTSVMERLALRFSAQPQRIYAVVFVGRHEETHNVISDPLWLGPEGFSRVGLSSHIATGWFEVSSTRFPRVYRSMVASCANFCQLYDSGSPGPPGQQQSKPVLDVTRVVKSGLASIEWVQTTPEPRLGLTLRLYNVIGKCIDETEIAE